MVRKLLQYISSIYILDSFSKFGDITPYYTPLDIPWDSMSISFHPTRWLIVHTSKGALSASSSTKALPNWAARTKGESWAAYPSSTEKHRNGATFWVGLRLKYIIIGVFGLGSRWCDSKGCCVFRDFANQKTTENQPLEPNVMDTGSEMVFLDALIFFQY